MPIHAHPARGAALRPRPHRHQAGLRQGRLRRLHGARRRRAVLSCITLALDADGPRGHHHRGARARAAQARTRCRTRFDRCGALQCGFCTPGMLMSARRRCSTRNPQPTARRDQGRPLGQPLPLHRLHADRRRRARWPRAARGARRDERPATASAAASDPPQRAAAARRRPAEWTAARPPPVSAPRLQPRRPPHPQASTACEGRPAQAVYADDIHLPRMLHCQAPPLPARRTRASSASTSPRALAQPGRGRGHHRRRHARALRHHPLDAGRARARTRPARASSATPSPRVAARDERTADEALELIDVEYEMLPAR